MTDGMISGDWLNMYTGEKITVVNSVMDEKNQMILITNKGQMSFDEFSQNYIQYDDTAYNAQPPIKSSITAENPQDDDYLLIDDIPVMSTTNTITTNSNINANTINNNKIQTTVSKDNSIIDNIFSKITTTPNIQMSLNWDEFPINDIKTLTKYLNLTLDDIADYIVTKYVNKDAITLSVKDLLNNLI